VIHESVKRDLCLSGDRVFDLYHHARRTAHLYGIFVRMMKHTSTAIALIAAAAIAGGAALYARAQVAVGLPTVSGLQSFGGHLAIAGGTPTPAGGTLAAGSTDVAGTFTASAGSGSITFAAPWAAAPTCVIIDENATPLDVFTISATAITYSSITSTHIYHYICLGKTGG
jgi:hypothetical protein